MHLFTLKNGLKVILVPRLHTYSVVAELFVRVGSRYEAIAHSGAAHLIEHMLFKGTQKRPSNLIISRELDSIGASYNAFTTKEKTGFWVKSLPHSLEQCLEILSDMIFNSLFDEQELTREKMVVQEEIKVYEDNPSMHIGQLIEESLFGARHPLGWDIAGTLKTVQNMQRSFLVDFWRARYQPRNMVLCVAGALPRSTSVSVERHFGKKSKGNGVYPTFKKVSAISNQRAHMIIKKETMKEIELGIGFRAPDIHQEREQYAMKLFSIIFGGTMSSRLFNEIREKRGLCYSIHSGCQAYYDVGIFSIIAGVNREKISEALRAIDDEIKKVAREGITDNELSQAKSYLESQIVMSFEENDFWTNFYGRRLLLKKKIVDPKTTIKQMLATTTSYLNSVIARVLRKPRVIAAIGNVKIGEIEN
ncbi:MAG: insulinase family protein [Parcubacteria group bacterium]|nr:insulinase family protein [Parcubacteria group bacterium]